MKNQPIRHGDVGLKVINKAEGEIINHNGSFTLAYGEATSHSHVITVPKLDDMTVYRCADGGIIFTLKSEGRLTHEEHKTLIVPPGTYQIIREREYNYFEMSTQKVID